MKRKNYPIMWMEGMPINQHIFQQEYIYNQINLQNLFSNISSHHFGVIDLEWDTNQFNLDILSIKNLEAIMPNFMHVILDIEDKISINLSSAKHQLKSKELYIFLNLPKNFYSKQNNIPYHGFELAQKEVQDLNDKNNTAIINISKPNLFLSIEETPSIANVSLPLCKIYYNGINLQFSPYQPPVLQLKNNKFLIKCLEDLLNKMKDKFYYLKNKKYLNNYKEMNLYFLTKFIYCFENALINDVHPKEFFNNLNALLAESLFFQYEKQLVSLQKYDHYNYQELILSLFKYIENSINNIHETYTQIRFEKNNNVFNINIQNNSEYIIVGIEKNENASIQETLDWISSAIIYNENDIESLKIQRATGFKRSIIENFKQFQINEIKGLHLIKIEGDIKAGNLHIANTNILTQPNEIFLFLEEKI